MAASGGQFCSQCGAPLSGALPSGMTPAEIADVRRLEDLGIARLHEQAESASRLDTKAQLAVPVLAAATAGFGAIAHGLTWWQKVIGGLLLVAPMATSVQALRARNFSTAPAIPGLTGSNWRALTAVDFLDQVVGTVEQACQDNDERLQRKSWWVQSTFALIGVVAVAVIIGAATIKVG